MSHAPQDGREEIEAEIARLREVLSDACNFMLGDISGEAQRIGIIREAVNAGVELEDHQLARLATRSPAALRRQLDTMGEKK
jgi:hypothetical protein